jgi:hypothetical protein
MGLLLRGYQKERTERKEEASSAREFKLAVKALRSAETVDDA